MITPSPKPGLALRSDDAPALTTKVPSVMARKPALARIRLRSFGGRSRHANPWIARSALSSEPEADQSATTATMMAAIRPRLSCWAALATLDAASAGRPDLLTTLAGSVSDADDTSPNTRTVVNVAGSSHRKAR